MIKAIVFDCYGVLVGCSFWDLYRAAGGDAERDEAFIAEILGRANAALISEDDFARAVAGHLDISVAEWLALTVRLEQPNEELFAYIQSDLRPHYKIGLLSNANKYSVERRIPADKQALLDAMVVSGEVGSVKPQREIFELTAERLSVGFDEMVFIDDLERYVQAAEAYGIRSIQYRDLVSMKRELEALLQA